jgi:hypothetical protein
MKPNSPMLTCTQPATPTGEKETSQRSPLHTPVIKAETHMVVLATYWIGEVGKPGGRAGGQPDQRGRRHARGQRHSSTRCHYDSGHENMAADRRIHDDRDMCRWLRDDGNGSVMWPPVARVTNSLTA